MYNWENSNSKSKNKHSHLQFDSKNPTCSSSFLNKFNKSLKTHYPKSQKNEDFCSNSASTTPKNRVSSSASTTPRNRASSKITEIPKDEKMSSLRRACLVEKWMEKKVNEKVIAKSERNSSSSSTTLLEEFDLQDALFFSSSTTTTTTSSTSSSEIEYSVFTKPKQKPHVACFAPPPRPKPIKTSSNNSAFVDHFGEDNEEEFMNNPSKAANFYSNLKNLKQPISPGVRLTSFINSLFAKDGKTKKKKNNNVGKQSKTEESGYSYSYCSSASSFSRSCMNNKNNASINDKKVRDDGAKRTVRFCPVSVIVDDDSQACGYKTLREENEKVGKNDSNLMKSSKFGRVMSKRYEELKKLNGLEKESDRLQQQKKLEEVALDLLSGYWDSRLNKSHELSSINNKVNDDNYGVNYGVNYVQGEEEDEDEDEDDDDGFSCSSSDLFELDHLSLIGDELPVYESTKI